MCLAGKSHCITLHYIILHITYRWPTGLEVINEFFTKSSLLVPDKNSDLMTGAPAATLDHEESLTTEVTEGGEKKDRRNLVPQGHCGALTEQRLPRLCAFI